MVFVTTDPARDTREALRDYLDHFDPSFIGAHRRPRRRSSTVGKPLASPSSMGEKLPSGGYEVDATAPRSPAIDGDDEAPVYWTQDTSAAQFADDIHTLLATTTR